MTWGSGAPGEHNEPLGHRHGPLEPKRSRSAVREGSPGCNPWLRARVPRPTGPLPVRPWRAGHWLKVEGLVGGGTAEGTRAALVPFGRALFVVDGEAEE